LGVLLHNLVAWVMNSAKVEEWMSIHSSSILAPTGKLRAAVMIPNDGGNETDQVF